MPSRCCRLRSRHIECLLRSLISHGRSMRPLQNPHPRQIPFPAASPGSAAPNTAPPLITGADTGNSSVNGLLRNHGVIRGAFVSPVLPRIPRRSSREIVAGSVPISSAITCAGVPIDHNRAMRFPPSKPTYLYLLATFSTIFVPLFANKCKKRLLPFLQLIYYFTFCQQLHFGLDFWGGLWYSITL